MAVSYKNKRRIVVDECVYYWYVVWDDSWWCRNVVHVLDEAMQPLCHYVAGNSEVRVYDRPRWVPSPAFIPPEEAEGAITPAVVAQIIHWYNTSKGEVQ